MLKRHPDFETLERVKRWPSLLNRFTYVCIFSAEHQAFWREGGNGYTLNPGEAWRLPFNVAIEQTRHCGPEKQIQFYNAARCEGSWPMLCLKRAFVEGAQWWQFKFSRSTMFPHERDKVEAEARRRYGER